MNITAKILNYLIFITATHTLNKTLSPFAQRKNHQQQQEGIGFWNNLQYQTDATNGIAAPSPNLGRKRFQTTIPVADSQSPPQFNRPQGNTSPIGKLSWLQTDYFEVRSNS